MNAPRRPLTVIGLAVTAALAGCGAGQSGPAAQPDSPASPTASIAAASPAVSNAHRTTGLLPGMPPPLSRHDVYAADRPGNLSPAVRHDRRLIYVPNSQSNTVSVINPKTYKVIATHRVGTLPQHVTPSYDLRWLYVLNDEGNTVTRIDPRTGKFVRTIPVTDPYNMYFTPDGKYAIAVAERLSRLEFLDAHTLRPRHNLSVPCAGVDHADFSANGRFALFSCEFSGQLLVVNVAKQKVVRTLRLPGNAMPQDVKLSPDGKIFYVADLTRGGVWLVDAHTYRRIGFLPTGRGAHGLYVSRDSRFLYVTDRGAGAISVVNLAKRKVAKTWRIPGGGSPDMGGISANGKVLWLSGRYNAVVYAISTRTGRLLARIPVGSGPHGLCVYPQPGRYSLGHTGVFR